MTLMCVCYTKSNTYIYLSKLYGVFDSDYDIYGIWIAANLMECQPRLQKSMCIYINDWGFNKSIWCV